MSKILAVFGATGQQGGSVINYVLKNLPNSFKIKGITRDANSKKAKQLSEQGVEMVSCNTNDKSSVLNALKGAHIVFTMTSMAFGSPRSEYDEGKLIADSAVESHVEYIIWSTLPAIQTISNGEFTHVKHFDDKAKVEIYIRKLPIKSSFFAPGVFFQNFCSIFPLTRIKDNYTFFNILDPDTKMPWIDIVEDAGNFVGLILTSPEEFNGKTVYGVLCMYSFKELAKIIESVTKQPTLYTQISKEKYKLLQPPVIADDIVEMFAFHEKYGYYGPKTSQILKENASKVEFTPRSPEQFFKVNSIRYE